MAFNMRCFHSAWGGAANRRMCAHSGEYIEERNHSIYPIWGLTLQDHLVLDLQVLLSTMRILSGLKKRQPPGMSAACLRASAKLRCNFTTSSTTTITSATHARTGQKTEGGARCERAGSVSTQAICRCLRFMGPF